MTTHEEYCKGCRTYVYRNSDKHICIDGIKNSQKCPCAQCLIKSMCREGCENFFKIKKLERLGKWVK